MHTAHNGKTYMACALGLQACREGYSVRYLRVPRLLSELALARGDGRYPRVLASLACQSACNNDPLGGVIGVQS